jgi:hypothetical protein
MSIRRRGRLIFPVAIVALVFPGIVTAANAVSDHPKKKVTHASKPVSKPVSIPAVPDRQRTTM